MQKKCNRKIDSLPLIVIKGFPFESKVDFFIGSTGGRKIWAKVLFVSPRRLKCCRYTICLANSKSTNPDLPEFVFTFTGRNQEIAALGDL